MDTMKSDSKMKINLISYAVLVTFLFGSVLSGFAETRIFIKEYSYQASELDSKVSSRTIALEQVKRLLLEELGTYLQSYTEVKNFQLNKDTVTALTGGIVQVKVIDEKWDGDTYWLKAQITADPKNVAKSIEVLKKDRQKSKELEQIRQKADTALKEIERLKRDLAASSAKKSRTQLYNRTVETLTTLEQTKKVYFVASKYSNIYHKPTCKWAQKIKPRNLITFSSGSEARRKGYHPCKVCKPSLY